ncbi:hypothetical protein BZG36_00523 [Bifiguratus adelaidae]|uniref:F-box domain-containing protein n=1 Tax=Bifiguratus adelaidae TaxID=1938954 RepID=A0A261Y7B5_9FUNG|nr:hypothetical protein BZG36_00523 [Bifiguratus adelaidae]
MNLLESEHILDLVFRFLDHTTLFCCRRVCEAWLRASKRDQLFRGLLFGLLANESLRDLVRSTKTLTEGTWEERYKLLWLREQRWRKGTAKSVQVASCPGELIDAAFAGEELRLMIPHSVDVFRPTFASHRFHSWIHDATHAQLLTSLPSYIVTDTTTGQVVILRQDYNCRQELRNNDASVMYEAVTALGFMDGREKFLMAAGNVECTIWDAETVTKEYSISLEGVPGTMQEIKSLGLVDRYLVLAASDARIYIYDVDLCKLVQHIQPAEGILSRIVASRSDLWMSFHFPVTALVDGTDIYLATGSELQHYVFTPPVHKPKRKRQPNLVNMVRSVQLPGNIKGIYTGGHRRRVLVCASSRERSVRAYIYEPVSGRVHSLRDRRNEPLESEQFAAYHHMALINDSGCIFFGSKGGFHNQHGFIPRHTPSENTPMTTITRCTFGPSDLELLQPCLP